MEDILTKRY